MDPKPRHLQSWLIATLCQCQRPGKEGLARLGPAIPWAAPRLAFRPGAPSLTAASAAISTADAMGFSFITCHGMLTWCSYTMLGPVQRNRPSPSLDIRRCSRNKNDTTHRRSIRTSFSAASWLILQRYLLVRKQHPATAHPTRETNP
jgi:hypothetical protein